MTTSDSGLTLTVERVIDAPAEPLFDAWLDPASMKRFLCPGEATVTKAFSDAFEGGQFEVFMDNGSENIRHSGIYQQIERPSRLVFTWESPVSVDDSTVTLTFTPGTGGTHVKLTQTRFIGEDALESHRLGWTDILAKLARLA